MPLVRKSEAPIFNVPGLTVTGLASPRRGASEVCIWRLVLDPSTPGLPHSVTREETFLALSGRAVATVDGIEHALDPGDALIVPPHVRFSLANPSSEPFEAVVTLPVGGKAITDGAAFTPPWAE
jgi:mannose-6-phosphate isomerase-like protein (cupin superfamily)